MGSWHWFRACQTTGGRAGGTAVGTVTVADSPTAPLRPHVFVLDIDGRLWLNWFDGSSWQETSFGMPSGVKRFIPVGVTTFREAGRSDEYPYAFVWGDDNNLWCLRWSGTTGNWSNQGNPGYNTIFLSAVGVASGQDVPTSKAHSAPYVFIVVHVGDGYRLWVNWYDIDQWRWDQITGGGTVDGDKFPGFGAVSVRGSYPLVHTPYAFIQDSGGYDYIWAAWWNKSTWQWDNLGNPPLSNNLQKVGAVAIADASDAPQRPSIFVVSPDGNLWFQQWSQGAWQPQWGNLGTPALMRLNFPVGLTAARSASTEPQQPYVFFAGDDGNLWVNTWDGLASVWTSLGRPPEDVGIQSGVGAVTLQDSPDAPERPYAFIAGSDGNLWISYWSPDRL